MVNVIEKIEILKDSNDKIVVDAICAFSIEFNNTVHNFCIATANELDQNGLVKLLVSEIVDNALLKISDEALWGEVKNVMRAIISGSSYTYSYIKMPKSIKASNDFARVIAVQEAAKTQLISDYMAKRPVETVSVSQANNLIDNPAIYPTENPDTGIGHEVTPGISVEIPTNNDTVKASEEIKPVNVMDVSKEVQNSDEPEVSMDDLVKQAIEKSEEPTAFDRQEEEKNLAIDATKLVNELENYIRLVVKDEIKSNK